MCNCTAMRVQKASARVMGRVMGGGREEVVDGRLEKVALIPFAPILSSALCFPI
jgi:hypothetical protein